MGKKNQKQIGARGGSFRASREVPLHPGVHFGPCFRGRETSGSRTRQAEGLQPRSRCAPSHSARVTRIRAKILFFIKFFFPASSNPCFSRRSIGFRELEFRVYEVCSNQCILLIRSFRPYFLSPLSKHSYAAVAPRQRSFGAVQFH